LKEEKLKSGLIIVKAYLGYADHIKFINDGLINFEVP
jgi:hypothetical protein